MKGRGVLAMVFVGAVASAAAAETEDVLQRGRIELGTDVSLSVSSDSGEDARTEIRVPLRLGVMVTDRLELEGEMLLSYYDLGSDEGSTGVIAAGHALYHFKTSERAYPYLLAGAGYGNGAEFLGAIIDAGNVDTTVLRAGVGVKTFLGRRASLRAEYRYSRFRWSQGVHTENLNNHKVLVGFSVWFR